MLFPAFSWVWFVDNSMALFRIVTQYFRPETGAPQVRLGAMVDELIELGHQVEVVTAAPNYPEGKVQAGYSAWKFQVDKQSPGLRVLRCPIFPSNSSSIIPRLASYLTFSATSLFPCLFGRRADYVFVESPPLFLGASTALAARLRGERLLVNISDLWPESIVALGMASAQATSMRMMFWLEKRLYSSAYAICVVTDGIRKSIEQRFPDLADRVVEFPNGVDSKRFPDVARNPDSTDPVRVIYAGLHGVGQGLGTLLDAADRLRNQPVEFLLVGDGPEKPELMRRKAELGLDKVEFRDPVPADSIPGLMAQADVAAVLLKDLPLFEGARPSKLFPALAAGLPIVYSGRGEGARLIEDSGAGIVVEPENPDKLAAALLEMAKDRRRLLNMGVSGRQYAKKNFEWKAIVARWLDGVNALG